MSASAERRIPTTMATQHPDNARGPYWQSDEFIRGDMEVEECYLAFKDLGCREYMWDWEGKYVDEAAADKLLTTWADFFLENPLGHQFFLTIRIPNIWIERSFRASRAFMSISTAQDIAMELGMPPAPIFEVILPMTDDASKMVAVQRAYHHLIRAKCDIFEVAQCGPSRVDIIPLVEGVDALFNCSELLFRFDQLHKKEFGYPQAILRGFIARSDPAQESGLIPAVLAAKAAMSEFRFYQNESGTAVAPILGVGSLPFRGGLSPWRVRQFLDEYRGVHTVTLQSAFRYDYPKNAVKQAISILNVSLPSREPVLFSPEEKERIREVGRAFEEPYQQTIGAMATTINEISEVIPPRRERLPHTGRLGYGRRLREKILPRAINFCGALYSLGIPPELIGAGRGLKRVSEEGLLSCLEGCYKYMREDLVEAGHYLNRENLELIARDIPALEEVEADVRYIEELFGVELGPRHPSHFLHRNHTSSVLFSRGRAEDMKKYFLEAARLRRSIG